MKKTTLFIALVLSASTSFSQTILGINVLPPSPTTNDDVAIIVTSTFTSGGCDLQYQNFNIVGNTISTYQLHCPGMLTVICTSIDTIHIGQFAVGNYFVESNLFAGGYDSLGHCSSYSQTDQSAIQFSVSLESGINENNQSAPKIFINSEKIKISNLTGNFNFVLYDISGKEIMSRQVSSKENDFSISVDAGMYFYSIRKEGMNGYTGKLLVSE